MPKTKQSKPKKVLTRKAMHHSGGRSKPSVEALVPSGFSQLGDDQQLALLKELAGAWADDVELATIFKQMAGDVRKRRKVKKAAS